MKTTLALVIPDDTVCVCSCGLCCGKAVNCDSCLHASLRATGLPDTAENFDRLRRIENAEKSRWFSGNGYSWELGKIRDEVFAQQKEVK